MLEILNEFSSQQYDLQDSRVPIVICGTYSCYLMQVFDFTLMRKHTDKRSVSRDGCDCKLCAIARSRVPIRVITALESEV
jgi:hypothetical protein